MLKLVLPRCPRAAPEVPLELPHSKCPLVDVGRTQGVSDLRDRMPPAQQERNFLTNTFGGGVGGGRRKASASVLPDLARCEIDLVSARSRKIPPYNLVVSSLRPCGVLPMTLWCPPYDLVVSSR